MDLSDNEYLEYVSCSYSDRGVHTLTFKTDQNQLLLGEGEIQDEGTENVDINLADYGRAIVGLKAGFGEGLEMLAIYTAV